MWFFRKKIRSNRILALIDLENLLLNLDADPLSFSLVDGFDKLMRQLGTIGTVENVFVFAPVHTITLHLETLHRLGFYPIPCPKIKDKKGQELDTVDNTLIQFGLKITRQIPWLTHLCLGSGDKDYLPLLREAVRRGLKIAIAAGNINSLGNDLINFADRTPGGKKMIFLFSPTREIQR